MKEHKQLSERAWAEVNSLLFRSFEWSVDYTLPNEEFEGQFLLECETLDEIAEFCGITAHLRESFVERGHQILAHNDKGET